MQTMALAAFILGALLSLHAMKAMPGHPLHTGAQHAWQMHLAALGDASSGPRMGSAAAHSLSDMLLTLETVLRKALQL